MHIHTLMFRNFMMPFNNILHCDNQCDVFALAKGYTGNYAASSQVRLFCMDNLPLQWYGVWIGTKENRVADALSRFERLDIVLRDFPDAIEFKVTKEVAYKLLERYDPLLQDMITRSISHDESGIRFWMQFWHSGSLSGWSRERQELATPRKVGERRKHSAPGIHLARWS